MTSEMLSLKWNNHRSSFLQTLSTVRKKVSTFLEVTTVVNLVPFRYLLCFLYHIIQCFCKEVIQLKLSLIKKKTKVNFSHQSKYADATVACDGEFFKIHKLVFSTCSDYFEQMFEQTECKHPVIVLKDVKGWCFQALLSYMYVGEVNVEQERLAELIKTAECLQVRAHTFVMFQFFMIFFFLIFTIFRICRIMVYFMSLGG